MPIPLPVPLLLDTDIGDDVDDVFALLLAALEPAVTLLGVTTVFGDAPQRGRIARKLLDLAGRPDVPVAVGAGQTLGGRDPGPGHQVGRGLRRPTRRRRLRRMGDARRPARAGWRRRLPDRARPLGT